MGGYSDDLEKRLNDEHIKLLEEAAAKAKEAAAHASSSHNARERSGLQGKKNIYQCQTCLGLICTVDRDKGVTPFMIDCKSTPGCKGPMQSGFYMVHPLMTPTFEWYLPNAEEFAAICASLTGPHVEQRAAAYVDHVGRGGLFLRPIEREAEK